MKIDIGDEFKIIECPNSNCCPSIGSIIRITGANPYGNHDIRYDYDVLSGEKRMDGNLGQFTESSEIRTNCIESYTCEALINF